MQAYVNGVSQAQNHTKCHRMVSWCVCVLISFPSLAFATILLTLMR